MYTFIASDLDGTLLNPEHRLDPYTIDTLQALEARGLRFAIATGRHVGDVRGIRETIGIRAHLITSNGARVHDPDGRLIHSDNIDPAIVRAITQPDMAGDIMVNYYLDEEWLTDRPCEWLADMHQDSGFHYREADLVHHDGAGVGKVLYIADHAPLLALEQRLLARFADRIYLTFSADNCLEVMAPGVSKGHALRLVLDDLGLRAADTLAFGDNQNDIEMLQLAGHPRMMGNAHPRLMEQLPGVTQIERHAVPAVARHLRTLFGLPL